jgi:hypothetical protein
MEAHEGFSMTELEHDISIITLKGEWVFNDMVQPIEMFEDNNGTEAGTNCVNSGWGLTNGNGVLPPNALHKVNIDIVGQEDCESMFPGYIKPGMICAGERGHGACNVSSTDK